MSSRNEFDFAGTDCTNCTFADPQTGCKFDRIAKFEAQGSKPTLQDNGFYKIDGRVCNLHRDKGWGGSPEDARRAVSLKVDALIYADSECSLYDVKSTIYSLLLQNPLPHKIVVMKHDGVFEATDVIRMLRDMDMQGVPWSVLDCAPDLELPALVDDAMRKCSGEYYAVFTAGHEVRRDFLNRLDKAYNDDCRPFLMVEADDDFNGLVLNSYMHKFVGGNKTKLLTQQLYEAAQSQGWEKMIVRFDDL